MRHLLASVRLLIAPCLQGGRGRSQRVSQVCVVLQGRLRLVEVALMLYFAALLEELHSLAAERVLLLVVVAQQHHLLPDVSALGGLLVVAVALVRLH
jgi:hypothetical protein